MDTIISGKVKIPVLEKGPGRLVVNKPAGISVHNNSGKDVCSLADTFVAGNRRIQKIIDFDPDFGVNPVHRLDKGTSGVMLLAVNRDMFHYYAQQFESRIAKKHYVAILHGCLDGDMSSDSWRNWRWPLSKAAGGRKNPAGAGKRQPCETRYRILGHSGHYTKIEVALHSGRTHQIRRHAKLAGHPVVGDPRYGSPRAINYLKENHSFVRLGLHAHTLTLCLAPGTSPKTIGTGKIPDSMTTLFENDKISILPVDPRQPEITRMIAELDEYQATLYPPESNHLVDVEKLAGNAYYFIAAFEGGSPLAIASFKREEAYVEIKRLYVPKRHRGRKVALRLMKALQKKAVSEGYSEARLETGIHQHEAIALYKNLGYTITGPFGDYTEDPLSVFMGKKL